MERNFGYTFTIVLAIIASYPILYDKPINVYFTILAIFMLGLTIFMPHKLFIPAKLWLNFAIIISHITSPIIMILIYIISLMPSSLIIRILGIDLLELKIDKKKDTYWKDAEPFDEKLDKQY